MEKNLVLFLAGLMALGLFFGGCGDSSDDTDTDTDADGGGDSDDDGTGQVDLTQIDGMYHVVSSEPVTDCPDFDGDTGSDAGADAGVEEEMFPIPEYFKIVTSLDGQAATVTACDGPTEDSCDDDSIMAATLSGDSLEVRYVMSESIGIPSLDCDVYVDLTYNLTFSDVASFDGPFLATVSIVGDDAALCNFGIQTEVPNWDGSCEITTNLVGTKIQ